MANVQTLFDIALGQAHKDEECITEAQIDSENTLFDALRDDRPDLFTENWFDEHFKHTSLERMEAAKKLYYGH